MTVTQIQEEGSIDMSIVSDEEGDQEEQEIAHLPDIQLSFGNGKGGAWDDRELIDTYDAAMEEFHLLNPGPGSWLDKATAAMLVGRSLPGATAKESAWYTASLPTPPIEASSSSIEPTVPPPAKRHRKDKSLVSHSLNPYAANGTSTPTITTSHINREPSPTFTPPSPPQSAKKNAHFVSADSYDGAEWASSNQSPSTSGALVHNPASSMAPISSGTIPSASSGEGVFPTPGSVWKGASSVSTEDALSYAMNAQYWAGYWMGLARAATSTPSSTVAPPHPEPQSQPVSNVVVSRQQYQNKGNGIRR